ncbi:MAG: DUF4184 family protein [Gammaproteobacteria bacterium]
MPFTISHAAIVLPFSRLLARGRLLSAVVIGAMVPDFGLFFPWRVQRFESHSVEGLLAFCLPVGLFTYWIFQYLVKTPVLEVLPQGAYARWRPFSSPAQIANLLQWILAALGVLAGATSHLGWDAFTHEGARGVRLIPWLEDPIVEIGNHHVAGVRLLQDGSSLIGLAIVIGFVLYGLRRGRAQPPVARSLRPAERRAWVLAYAIAAITLSTVCLLWARAGEPAPRSVTVLASGVAVAALRGLSLALLGVSLGLDWRLRALRRAGDRPPAVP